MVNIDSLREVKLIKKSERQAVYLVEDNIGKRYLKREITADKREIYKSLQKIKHPNLPKIYYVAFTDHTTIIEEYIEGISLSEFMERKIKLKKKSIYSVSNQILSALEALHSQNIIHRDVKPDNIMINSSYQVWLIDYDIARVYRKELKKDTDSMGTFGYAPIEQFGMMPTDFKTDIYAFGVTLSALLEYANIKDSFKKVADKCKRLDPSQRYKSVAAVKKAILFDSFKYLPICLAAVAAAIVITLNLISIESSEKFIEQKSETGTELDQNKDNKYTTSRENEKIDTSAKKQEKALAEEAETKLENAPENKLDDTKSKEESKQTIDEETIDFEGEFFGFSSGIIENEYRKYDYFSNVSIFSTDTPYQHLLFLDDISKNGKIKFGKNNAIIDARITLIDGTLTVVLNDKTGNSLSQQFKFTGQYTYDKIYTNNLRKNADIICYDLDDDGATELLIGLNEGTIGASDGMLYNYFNYCIAWCIKYDEITGFTICDGDMFSKEHSFSINRYIQKLNVYWEEFGDISGYYLNGNTIEPTF